MGYTGEDEAIAILRDVAARLPMADLLTLLVRPFRAIIIIIIQHMCLLNKYSCFVSNLSLVVQIAVFSSEPYLSPKTRHSLLSTAPPLLFKKYLDAAQAFILFRSLALERAFPIPWLGTADRALSTILRSGREFPFFFFFFSQPFSSPSLGGGK